MSENDADNQTKVNIDKIIKTLSPHLLKNKEIELKNQLKGERQNPSKSFEYKDLEERAHAKGIEDHYNHKNKWSWFLISLIGFMLLFQSVLIILVGLHILDFSGYEWLLPALLVQNLGQIMTLAYVIVRSLFKDVR